LKYDKNAKLSILPPVFTNIYGPRLSIKILEKTGDNKSTNLTPIKPSVVDTVEWL